MAEDADVMEIVIGGIAVVDRFFGDFLGREDVVMVIRDDMMETQRLLTMGLK
jgi:hypothetical protein